MNSNDRGAGQARAELIQRAEQWQGHYERLAAKHCIEREAAELIRDLLAVLAETPPPPQEPHRCVGCGHRWDGPLKGAELCGDCWRKTQPIVHASEGR